MAPAQFAGARAIFSAVRESKRMRRYLPKPIADADLLSIALILALTAVAALRIFLAFELPIWLRHPQTHEDALFMRLAASLVSGDWLGPYDHLTLSHGPGYPTFLALSSLSGLAVSVTQALFQIAAIAVASWAAYRLTASRALASTMFVVLALDPVGFLPDVLRVIPEQIYWAQALLVFALAAMALHVPRRTDWQTVWLGILAGALLAWMGLTGDNVTWLLPGLLVMAAGGILVHQGERRSTAARTVGAALAGYIAVNALAMCLNLSAYGTFSAGGGREASLQAALDALQDIDAGPVKPHVPVPLAARTAAAEVSPTFKPLADMLVPGGRVLSDWTDRGCRIYREACGDIAGEWLVPALREAAARNGLYDNPGAAASGFDKIAAEIAAACADGRLQCHRRRMTLAPSLAGASSSIAAKAAFLDGPVPKTMEPTQTHHMPELFERYWALLNRPFVTIPGEKGMPSTASGWYRDSASSGWPGFAVYAQDGDALPFSLTRHRSPDLQQAFGDDRLGWNRFLISYRCPDKCTIAVNAFGRPELRLVMDREKNIGTTSDSVRIHVDDVNYDWLASAPLGPMQTFAWNVRQWLVAFYAALIPLLLLSGIVALASAGDGAIAARSIEPVLVVAGAAWLTTLARIANLAHDRIGPFPAATLSLDAPTAYLAVLSTLLSFGAVIVLARTLYPFRFKAA